MAPRPNRRVSRKPATNVDPTTGETYTTPTDKKRSGNKTTTGVAGDSGDGPPVRGSSTTAKPIGGLPPDYLTAVGPAIPNALLGANVGVPYARGAGRGELYTNLDRNNTVGVAGIRYFKGDQFNQFPTKSQDIQALQELMIQAGFLDPKAKGLTTGAPDGPTMAVFTKLLAMSNQLGTEWQLTLSNRLAAQGADGAAEARKAKVPPLVVTLGNPDDIKATAEKVSRTLLGQDLPDAELNQFVTSYQAAQTAAQQADYQAKYGQFLATGAVGPESGGTSTAAATTEAGMGRQAEEQIRATRGPQVTGYGIGSQVMSQLESLRATGQLSGGGGD